MTIEERVKNNKEIIALKKSSTKFVDAVDSSIFRTTKIALKADTDTGPEVAGEMKVTIVGNTYNWMDSHEDAHIEGIFTKSIQENGTKVLHLHDHIHQLTAKVGRTSSVYEQKISWLELGVEKEGDTTALLMDSTVIKAYNSIIFDMYTNKEINQHSVGMQYVSIVLCINDADYKSEYSNWQKYHPLLGNGEKAEELGYFYAVTEAKLKEISCVIAGSNELTPTLDTKDIEEIEPVIATQKTEEEKAAIRTSTLKDHQLFELL